MTRGLASLVALLTIGVLALPQAASAQAPDDRAAAREFSYAAYRLRVKIKAAVPAMNQAAAVLTSRSCSDVSARTPEADEGRRAQGRRPVRRGAARCDPQPGRGRVRDVPDRAGPRPDRRPGARRRTGVLASVGRGHPAGAAGARRRLHPHPRLGGLGLRGRRAAGPAARTAARAARVVAGLRRRRPGRIRPAARRGAHGGARRPEGTGTALRAARRSSAAWTCSTSGPRWPRRRSDTCPWRWRAAGRLATHIGDQDKSSSRQRPFPELNLGIRFRPVAAAFGEFVRELDRVPTADRALVDGRNAWRYDAEFFAQVGPPPANACEQLRAWRLAGFPRHAPPRRSPQRCIRRSSPSGTQR